MYGETMLSGQQDATEPSGIGGSNEAEVDEGKDEPVARGRPRRAAQQNKMKAKAFSRKQAEGYDSLGSIEDESDATSSGNEWDGGDEDEPDDHIDDDDDDDEEEEDEEDVDMSDNSVAAEEEDDPQQSLVVSLRYTQKHQVPSSQDTPNGPPAKPENHSTTPTPTGSSKVPPPPLSETAPSTTEHVPQSSHHAPKPTQDAAPTPHSRSTEHAARGQYPASSDPKPQVSRPLPPPPPEEKNHTPSLPQSQSEEKPTSSPLAVTFGNGPGGI